MAHYAWSPIHGADSKGNATVVAKVGDTVTAEKLGVGKEDFDAMVDAGSVRSIKPPELPENFQGSMVEHLRNQIREAELKAGATLEEASVETMAAIGEVS